MRYLLIPLLFFITTGMVAQEKEQVNSYNSSLNLGGMLNVGNRSLKFKEVISDSRCPVDVTCIWAGEAIVLVEIFKDGKCMEEKLITISSSHISLEFKAANIIYNISGVSLSPLPSVNKTDISQDYRLKFRISETAKI